jgi:DNA-binding IclR family transcriptional regulator
VRCVAAPVYDFRGKVVAAVGISGPAGRLGLERIEEIGRIVMRASKGLSDRMSFKRT